MMPTLLNNRYRMLQTLGSGGFGNTFLAEDTYMPSGRRCVIKQLKPVTHDPQTYKLVQERFQREAAVLEELGEGSPQIPRLYAYFSEAGQFYLVQEWIQGDTLTKKVEQGGKLPDNEVKQILVSLLPVLDYVHSRHMVHRDIKPDNIIIRQSDGLPVLIDFGAVKEAMNTVVNDPANSAHSMVIGTPGFMSPEQAGGRPTYGSDLYSLGLTAVYLLTGKMAQELQTDAHTGEILWRQYAPNINPNLAMVIDRSIRFNARDRFATAREMLNALQSAVGAPSEMATVAVSPGGLSQPPNGSTPAITNPSPQQTAPVGTSPARQQGNDRKPLIIGALVAGGLLAAVAIAVGLARSPERSSPVSSSTEPATEEPRQEQSTQEPRSQQPPSIPTASRSRSQPADSEPATEEPIQEPPSSQTPSPSRRSQPTDSEPEVVPSESRSQREAQAPSARQPESVPSQPIPVPPPESRDNNQNPDLPRKIPAFAPGAQERYVKEELGNPTKTSKGAWQNTRALLYEDFVPGEVSLGYLFDPSTGRLRQTEVSFSPSVDVEMMSATLEQMLSGNVSSDIKQGLESVYQRQSNSYKFVSGRSNRLEGVIQRNSRDRIYIGVWEEDLH
jgi:serine/threonine-protein kinase